MLTEYESLSILLYTKIQPLSLSQTLADLTEIQTLFRDSKESFFVGAPKQATLAHIAGIL